MKTLASLVLLAAAPGFAAAQATKEDLKKLAKSGVSEELIIAYIKANGYQGRPSSDDLIELKAAGIGDEVLTALLSPPEAAPPATTVERPVVASGTWSVSVSNVSPASHYTPACRPYYTGYISRPYYSPYYYGPYYYGRGCHRPYYSTYCGSSYARGNVRCHR